MILLLILLLPSLLFAEHIKLCFKAYYFIFPVGYSCLKVHKDRKGVLRIRGEARSVFLGSLLGGIEITSRSKADFSLRSKRFLLRIKEGKNLEIHIYEFVGNSVKYEIRLRKGKVLKVVKGKIKVERPLDPLSLSLYILLIASKLKKKCTFFYGGKIQSVSFRMVGRENLERLNRNWNTLKIRVVPKVRTSSFLKPKGVWFVWIDEKLRIPIRIKVSFTLGSANLWLDSIEGNPLFFYSLKESFQQKP